MKRRRIVAVVIIAPALGMAVPMIPPVIAQEAAACTTWIAEMMEDEGGPVLTAQACSIDRPDAYITVTCANGTAGVRFDLAAGAEASPEPNETTEVTFATATDQVTVEMGYEEYDGYFSVYPRPDDPLIQLLKAGETVTMTDVPGRYPEQHYSLKGSTAALGKLTAACD